jgi:hypothetical protein
MTCGCPGFEDASAISPEIGGFGSAALRYQRMGYAVLPLVRGGKKPHPMLPLRGPGPGGLGGVHWATRDERLVPWAWRDLDPAANVGVATGSSSCLMVIDLDVKSGPNGIEEFARFMAEYRLSIGWEPPPAVLTPSGGQHIWLRTPAGLKIPERPAILPGVDVKGDGGLVVAPPSRKMTAGLQPPGESMPEPVLVPYIWTRGCPCSVPEAPEWIFDWLAWTPPPDPEKLAAQVAAQTGLGSSDADFEQLQSVGVPYGERNEVLYRLACSRFRKRNGDLTQVTADIRSVWEASDRTGFGWREVLVLIESAHKFHAAKVLHERELVNRWRSLGR